MHVDDMRSWRSRCSESNARCRFSRSSNVRINQIAPPRIEQVHRFFQPLNQFRRRQRLRPDVQKPKRRNLRCNADSDDRHGGDAPQKVRARKIRRIAR